MAIEAVLFERLVQAAGAAPSSHNTQPWRFARAGDAVELHADRGRALPVNDPHDRELTLSCGCALANLEAAAEALGLAPRVQAFPDGVDADLLARVHLQSDLSRTDAEPPAAITQRRTWRGDVEPDPPDAALQARLQQAAAVQGCSLHVVEADARAHVAGLVEAGDRAQWDDPRWRRELALWMRTRPAPDGLAVPGGVAPLTRAIVRAADLGAAVGPRDAATVRGAPWLGVVATAADDPAAWLAAGRALQRMLLDAAAGGFQAAYFNQPIQVDAIRPALSALCDGAWPQVMIRLGRPRGRSAPTARRALADLLAPPTGTAPAC